MKAIYKLVNTSTRLPDKTGSYFVIVHGDDDLKLVMSWNELTGDHQSVKEYMQDQAKNFKNNYQYWLEEESAATHQEGGECYVKVFCEKEQPIENTIADTDKGRLIYHIEVDQWRTLESGWVEKVPTFWYKLTTTHQEGRKKPWVKPEVRTLTAEEVKRMNINLPKP